MTMVQWIASNSNFLFPDYQNEYGKIGMQAWSGQKLVKPLTNMKMSADGSASDCIVDADDR